MSATPSTETRPNTNVFYFCEYVNSRIPKPPPPEEEDIRMVKKEDLKFLIFVVEALATRLMTAIQKEELLAWVGQVKARSAL